MTEAIQLEPVTALIPADRVKALKALAEKQERSLSWLVRRAVDSYIESEAKAA